ncbi:MAG: hypothetical protein PF795_02090 [Kiritimatiellae bacterium]|jgi:hypothetical protein|nr:hypothetical protein [Kiritimatiellia bacterium]
MKKTLLQLFLMVLLLMIGYVVGGMRSGKVATEQAYYSDLTFLVAIHRSLADTEVAEAKSISSLAIRGVLDVLDTIDDDPWSTSIFFLPTSEVLLDTESKGKLRLQAQEIATLSAPVLQTP